MGYSLDEVVERIRRVAEAYGGLGLVILFGSYAEGYADSLSDIDLLVDGVFDEGMLLLDLSASLNIPIDRIDIVLVEKAPIKVLARALSRGIIVLCRDQKRLAEIEGRLAISYPEAMEIYRMNRILLLNPGNGIDEARVLDMVGSIIKASERLRRLIERHSLEEFRGDEVLESALKWNVYEVAQLIIDTCAMIAAGLRLGVAESYRDYVTALVREGVMDRSLDSNIAELIALRNRPAHRYLYIGIEEVVEASRKIVEEVVPGFRRFVYSLLGKTCSAP